MNAAGIAERTRLPATVEVNGRVGEPHPDADPAMTREAREARIAWRLEHLDEWQRDLESLAHYDPGYAYDVAHEYDVDWTTDPDYGPTGIHLFEFDEDGVLYSDDDRPQAIELYMRDTARDRVGYRVVYQTRYGFMPEIAERVGLHTRQGRPSNTVKPDLIVMPSEEDLDPSRFPEDGQPRPDDAVPELVLEILSESTAVRDQEGKRQLYEYLGVREYLLYDLGGKRWDNSPRELLVYRLEGDAYRQVPPDPGLSEPQAQAFWSDVFDAYIRMMPDPQEDTEEFRQLPVGRRPPPLFQWRDAVQGRWRDRATDERDRIRQKGKNEGRTEERLEATIDTMREFLGPELADVHLDRIELIWRRDGPPADALRRVRDALRAPSEWRSLLLSGDPDDDRAAGREPPTNSRQQ